ncbi:hypothetical protein IMSAGC005_00270 [Lachnospiraceae bacterium]|nr:hypothetical protein IMSAGC005_00270 [Lachnospiraceae bacterium]
MKAIVWGAGRIAKDYYTKKVLYRNYEIIAFTDNNSALWHTEFNGVPILPPGEILKLQFDAVFIWNVFIDEIVKQLVEELYVPEDKIHTFQDLEKDLCRDLIKGNKDSKDVEIRKVLDYYQDKGFNIYGYYDKEPSLPCFVERDKEGWPFIMFEGKRMYYPKEYAFAREDGRECVYDVLFEQGEHSPHQYITKEGQIQEGSIIIDAGVCEGNFSLRYIDRAKKVYLIESDPEWMAALRRTFKDYEDKVVFCQKFLTRYDSATTITLDTLVKEKIDFLKMDIEGAEVDALLGGKEVLKRSNANCAICSYHRKNDAENISWIMKKLGYHTSESEGYMFFVYDERIADSMDFRRGLVYADKA